MIRDSKLTNTEQAIVIFIHGYLAQHQCAPSYDDIARLGGISKTAVASAIHSLRDKGWLRWTEGQPKTIQLWFQFQS